MATPSTSVATQPVVAAAASSGAVAAASLPPLPPLDFSGEWVLDKERSDSLQAVVDYHQYNMILRRTVMNMVPSATIAHDIGANAITITIVTPLKTAVEQLQLDGVERTLDYPYPRGRVPVTAFVRDDGRALVTLYRVTKHATDIERTDRQLLSMDTMLLEMTTLRATQPLPSSPLSCDTAHMTPLFKVRRIFKRVKPAEPHVQAAFGAHLMALSARRRLSVDTSTNGHGHGVHDMARRKSRATKSSTNGHTSNGHGHGHRRGGRPATTTSVADDSDDESNHDEHAAWATGACCVRGCRRMFRMCCPRLSHADASLLYPRTRKAIILANAKRAPQASEVAAALANVSSSSSSTDMSSSMPQLLRGLTSSNSSTSYGGPLSPRSPHLPAKVDPLITSLHKLEVKAAHRARRTMSKLDFLFVLLVLISLIGWHIIQAYFNEP